MPMGMDWGVWRWSFVDKLYCACACVGRSSGSSAVEGMTTPGMRDRRSFPPRSRSVRFNLARGVRA